MESRQTFGRTQIFSDVTEVNASNVRDVINNTKGKHGMNRQEIEYLYNYYKGRQPILGRTKQIRPEINNKVVVNRANEIVSFKTGYLLGEPVQYVMNSNVEDKADSVMQLNAWMDAENKSQRDYELGEWMHICGTAYRLILTDTPNEEDESPIEIYTLDPRNTWIVYSTDVKHKPLCAITYIVDETKQEEIYSVYTESEMFTVTRDSITSEPHALGAIPIIEYPANSARLGAFEPVLSLLDSISNCLSNQVDGIEQFIQSLMVFTNCDVDEDRFKALRESGAILIRSDSTAPAKVEYIVQELSQTETTGLADAMYDYVLTICGMPNRNGGSSTSDTGVAVVYRDGWSSAETKAKETEKMFKGSEKEFLKIVLRVLQGTQGFGLKINDLDIHFTRRNFENISSKATVLTQMLSSDKIHPRLAFEQSGMFPDPEVAYQMSSEYKEEQDRLNAERINEQQGYDSSTNSRDSQSGELGGDSQT